MRRRIIFKTSDYGRYMFMANVDDRRANQEGRAGEHDNSKSAPI
jgi:hypothetical protein